MLAELKAFLLKRLFLTYVPYLIAWTVYLVWGMKNTFSVDLDTIRAYDGSAVTVALAMQLVLLFFVVRDWIGVIRSFTLGYPSVFIALITKMQFCMIDQLLLAIFSIWGIVASCSSQFDTCIADEIEGC